ncbi:hypothetical protein [Streptomyces sp. NPDC003247]|uniref:hypothetical protein n=1 Tax=Streptomyces sp. NPDC003247 TaxID=3364677 RepID=UPI003695540F
MGLDITVLGLDWAELERTPAAERLAVLYEADCPDDDTDGPAGPRTGWVIPASPEVPWSGRYEFRGTLGSYKPHFWAANGWDTVRGFADPALREALDGFLGGLIWWGDDDEDGETAAGVFPSDPEPWRPSLQLLVPPPAVTALAAHWNRAAPLLTGLREAYDAHASRPGGWIADFEEFAALLGQWADLVDGAARRGWGLLALHV